MFLYNIILIKRGIEMKDELKILKAREFCRKVRKLADEADLPFFVVTDGASATKNNGCLAVKCARDNHIKWEKDNGFNPDEDWSNEKIYYIDFPKSEYVAYQERLFNGEMIYTTRVSSEVGKYEINKIYDSYFGKLKVVYFEHFDDINKHPFYNELTKEQLKEINFYIKENGYDLIGLIKI